MKKAEKIKEDKDFILIKIPHQRSVEISIGSAIYILNQAALIWDEMSEDERLSFDAPFVKGTLDISDEDLANAELIINHDNNGGDVIAASPDAIWDKINLVEVNRGHRWAAVSGQLEEILKEI